MSIQMVLLPVFVLVGLTFALLFWSGTRRRWFTSRSESASEAGDALYDPLHLAVLFYAVVALALPLRQMNLLMVLLAWVFVVTRFAYAGLFVTSGSARTRTLAYVAGALVLLAMWLAFALRILLS